MIPRLPTICIAAAAFHAATCAASAHSLTVETSAYLSYSLISGGGGMSNLHSSSDTSATSAAAAISATVQSTYLESRGRASYRSIGVESYLNGYHTFSGNVGGLATWYEGPATYAISTVIDEFTVSSPGETSGIMNLNFHLDGSLWKTWGGERNCGSSPKRAKAARAS